MPLEDIRHVLASCDEECLNGHYTKLINSAPVDLKGHSIVCCNDGGCESKVRILRSVIPCVEKVFK